MRMTVTGNQPPPYHTKGLQQCLEQIRVACAKGRIIAHEKGWTTTEQGMGHIETIRVELQQAMDTEEIP